MHFGPADCKQWYRFARLFCHAYWLPQATPLQYNPSRKRPRSPVAAMQVQLVFQWILVCPVALRRCPIWRWALTQKNLTTDTLHISRWFAGTSGHLRWGSSCRGSKGFCLVGKDFQTWYCCWMPHWFWWVQCVHWCGFVLVICCVLRCFLMPTYVFIRRIVPCYHCRWCVPSNCRGQPRASEGV